MINQKRWLAGVSAESLFNVWIMGAKLPEKCMINVLVDTLKTVDLMRASTELYGEKSVKAYNVLSLHALALWVNDQDSIVSKVEVEVSQIFGIDKKSVVNV